MITVPQLDQMVYTINDGKSIHHYLLDKGMNVVSTFSYSIENWLYQPAQKDLRQRTYANGKFYYYYKSGPYQISKEELNFDSQEGLFSDYISWNKKEQYLGSFVSQNKVWVLTTPNHSNILKFYSDSSVKELEL